jgi:hypothetical protein
MINTYKNCKESESEKQKVKSLATINIHPIFDIWIPRLGFNEVVNNYNPISNSVNYSKYIGLNLIKSVEVKVGNTAVSKQETHVCCICHKISLIDIYLAGEMNKYITCSRDCEIEYSKVLRTLLMRKTGSLLLVDTILKYCNEGPTSYLSVLTL